MKITVLGAAGGEAPGQNLTGFLIDEALLVDAGTIGTKLEIAEQRKIKNVLITHAHLDHIHALPFLLDNLIGRVDGPVNIYGHPDVLAAIHKNIFNNQIWPDFSALPSEEKPIMKFCPLQIGQSVQLDGYTIESVRVNHSFAALAYIISTESGSVVFSGDTGPVSDLWKKVGQLKKIHAVFIECSFSRRQQEMAKMTCHLCTADIDNELAKTGRKTEFPVYLYHLKPEYTQEIIAEAQALNSLQLKVAKSGDVLLFS